MSFVATFSVNVRPVENVPDARNPWMALLMFSRTPLATLPSAASVAACTKPPWISIKAPAPPNVLPPPLSSSVPGLLLTMPKPPVRFCNVRPGTTFDGWKVTLDPPTLKIVVAVSAGGAVSSRP